MFVTIKWPSGKQRARKLERGDDWMEKVEEWAGGKIVSCSAKPDGSPPCICTENDVEITTKYRV